MANKNQKRRIENLHRGLFFETRSYLWGERPPKRRWEKTGNQVFFPRIALTFRFVHFRSPFMMAAAERQVCGTVLFWPLFGSSFYFPFGEEEERLLLKTTISIIMLFSLTRNCPVTLCLSEKGFFFFLFFRARVRLWFPIKRNKRKRLSLYSFQKGASGGEKSKKCSFPQKLTSSGKIDTFTFFRESGRCCLPFLFSNRKFALDLCGKRGVVCQQRLFVYENELEEGFPFPSF